MIVYKCLNYARSSVVICGINSVQYNPLGEWTIAPPHSHGYGLLAFESYERAKNFDPYNVYEAEAEGVRSGKYLPPPLSPTHIKPGQWFRLKSVLRHYPPVWPKGTVMCDAIKLVRRVS